MYTLPPGDYIELPKRSKIPGEGWTTVPSLPRQQVHAILQDGGNYGVRMQRNEVVLDFDPRNYAIGVNEEQLFQQHFAFDLSSVPCVITPGGGKHYYFRTPEGFGGKVHGKIPGFSGIDVKACPTQVVGPGSIHPSGGVYEVDFFVPMPTAVDGLPVLPDTVLVQITNTEAHPSFTSVGLLEPEHAYLLLQKLNVFEFASNDSWFELMTAYSEVRGLDGEDEFVDWSIGDPLYAGDQHSIRTRWRSLTPGQAGNIGLGTFFKILKDHGVKDALRIIGGAAVEMAEFAQPELPGIAAPPQPEAPVINLLTPPFNDYGNAMRFAILHGNAVRYCHDMRKWLVWDGRRWAIDTTQKVKNLATNTMLEYFNQAKDAQNEDAKKAAHKSLTNGAIDALLALAQPFFPIRAEDLDRDIYLANFRNGILDLRTGELIPHDPQRYITKLIHHSYLPLAQCPNFMAFLRRILPESMVPFIQKAFGYSMTADTREKIVILCHGLGDNGKTTLLETLRYCIHEYATLLQINTLMSRQEDNNTQSDLADLRGARFVMTSETEEGTRFNEGKLKRITQGMGRIKAVRKYENPIEFNESHKLWIDANHKPEIRGVDHAIWRRLCLISFDTTIPKSEQNSELRNVLRDEAEGILAWGVQGAMRWFVDGLGRPPEVEQAVKVWREESDILREFFEDCCTFNEDALCTVNALRSSYDKWCAANGTHALGPVKFNARMLARGLTQTRNEKGDKRVWKGINLNHNELSGYEA